MAKYKLMGSTDQHPCIPPQILELNRIKNLHYIIQAQHSPVIDLFARMRNF